MACSDIFRLKMLKLRVYVEPVAACMMDDVSGMNPGLGELGTLEADPSLVSVILGPLLLAGFRWYGKVKTSGSGRLTAGRGGGRSARDAACGRRQCA